MSSQKNASGRGRWGKTSLFAHKNFTRRNAHISKDEKERFLNNGILPKFKSTQRSEKLLQKKNAAIQTDLLPEAVRILNKVREEYGNDGSFIEKAYGKRIGARRASEVIHNYLVEHGIDGMMSVYFSTELDCSGKMSWTGPMNKYNQPERRNYSMWVKNSNDNIYLRENGILSLSNHEIGTHFLRAFNDGLQPWYANRTLFGLGIYKSQALKDTEEGLASINTTFESNVKYLWGPAMLYYAACMSLELNFKDLFDDLHKYVADPDIRWKYVVRIKRGRNPTQLGGHGKDQCYFRGAVNILKNADCIDFNLLYAGKITVEDQCRVQRIARIGCIKTPYFLRDMQIYRRHLRSVIRVNGITKPKTPLVKEPHIKIPPPKSSDITKRQVDFSGKKQPKKEAKSLVLEAKKRILSTDANLHSSAFLLDEFSDNHIVLPTADDVLSTADNDVCSDVDHFTQFREDNLLHSASAPAQISLPQPTIVQEAPATSKPDLTPKIPTFYLTNRRKSDTYSLSRFSDSEDFDEIESMPKQPTSELQPHTARVGQSYRVPFCDIQQHTGSAPEEEHNMIIVENETFPEISSPKTRHVMTPSAKFHSPAPDITSNYVTPQTKTSYDITIVKKYPPIAKKSNIRSVTPREIRTSLPRESKTPSASENVVPKRIDAPEVTRSRRNTERSDVSSGSSKKSKKSIRKKVSSFFDDLIPFSRSRRKRVLPLPVND